MWTIGLQGEQIEKLREHIPTQSSVPCLMRLKKLMLQRLNQLEAKEQTQSMYDNANWSHLQADTNGRKAELKVILDLLDFVKD